MAMLQHAIERRIIVAIAYRDLVVVEDGDGVEEARPGNTPARRHRRARRFPPAAFPGPPNSYLSLFFPSAASRSLLMRSSISGVIAPPSLAARARFSRASARCRSASEQSIVRILRARRSKSRGRSKDGGSCMFSAASTVSACATSASVSGASQPSSCMACKTSRSSVALVGFLSFTARFRHCLAPPG